MMFRRLVLAIVLTTSAFTQNAALNFALPHAGQALSSFASARKTALETFGFDSSYQLSLSKPVQDKNFYLLSLFQRDRSTRALLRKNQQLKDLASKKFAAVQNAANCNSIGCIDELMRLDDATIDSVAAAMGKLANETPLRLLVKNHLRPSGVFIKYASLTDAQMLASAWKDAAKGLNRILSVYGLGQDPRYKDIDRVSFDVNTESYLKLLKAKIAAIKTAKEPLFFEPTLNFAMTLLEINRRDEAGRYEPLEQGENKATVQKLNKIRWSDYPYSFILVLGSGPSDSARLSPTGAKRSDVAAQLFLQHKAPLIIFSGGHVHPMQTPFCEAIEMKKYVMEKYRIPDTSILVDPYARHTTTNIRNAARLALRYRIPTDKTALVTSSETHITSTASDEFRQRCLNELGYFPVEFIKQISPVAAEFKPALASLFFDANDPLDP